MIDVEIISVCVGQVSGVGGPVGVVVDGSSAPRHRGEFVAGLPVDEVAFVEDAANGTLSVVDSTGELSLAAQPVMAAAWTLRRRGIDLRRAVLPFGPLPVGADEDSAWVGIPVTAAPPVSRVRCSSSAQLGALDPTTAEPGVYYWVWRNEERGLIAARRFGADHIEEPVSLAPVIGLVAEVRRPVTVTQPAGAELRARPSGDGLVVLGGHVRWQRSLTVRHRGSA